MAIRFIKWLFLCHIGLCYAQTADSVQTQKFITKAPLIDSNTITLQSLEQDMDSIPKTPLKDHELASKFDEKWFEELYSNHMFDTIYKSVTNLTYDDIEYPELHTDTLKARLKELDARTPFNVEYNPSLESVIKSYLKNRRELLQRMITLSGFYFKTKSKIKGWSHGVMAIYVCHRKNVWTGCEQLC